MNGPTPAIEKKFVSTSFGDIAYLEAGNPASPPVLFVHGIPTSSFLWRHVLRFLQGGFHCYAPDLMGLGDTRVDPDADVFRMDAQALMLEEFMTRHGHETFSLVCHDQGGAAAQLVVARRPERVRCFVVTNCVCFDNWPVPAIVTLQRLLRLPIVSELAIRSRVFHLRETRTPWSAFRNGLYHKDKLESEVIEEYLRPLLEGPIPRRRFIRFIRAGSGRYSQQAVEGLGRFERPTQVLWAADDPYLSPSWGKKLYELIPGACQFELIPFCGHFWQEERPSEFVSLMAPFLRAHGSSNELAGDPAK